MGGKEFCSVSIYLLISFGSRRGPKIGMKIRNEWDLRLKIAFALSGLSRVGNRGGSWAYTFRKSSKGLSRPKFGYFQKDKKILTCFVGFV